MESLTVIMTVRNGMPYLEEAVDSIFAQTLRDFSFLIIDNASEDGTRVFLEQAAIRAHGKRLSLRVERLPVNAGRTGALNLALGLVETELTAVMDADDISARSRLERQTEFLGLHPEVVLLGSDVAYINAQGRIVGEERFPATHKALRDHLPLYNPFAHSACMYRTGAARAAGGYDPSFFYAQDMALWIAMLRGGGRVASLEEKLALIRKHGGQATQNADMAGERALDNLRLCEAMLGLPGLGTSARQAALLRLACARYGLGEKKSALSQALGAVAEAPLHFFLNPLLWRRLVHSLLR
ncbi:MAG: glycosyltransferase [Desulfovibrio sp.]|jgi:glycosyltransferase involved in cell wall biosynthesis|nr:glycosyltransferase [Desulfovibrio sp.]